MVQLVQGTGLFSKLLALLRKTGTYSLSMRSCSPLCFVERLQGHDERALPHRSALGGRQAAASTGLGTAKVAQQQCLLRRDAQADGPLGRRGHGCRFAGGGVCRRRRRTGGGAAGRLLGAVNACVDVEILILPLDCSLAKAREQAARASCGACVEVTGTARRPYVRSQQMSDTSQVRARRRGVPHSNPRWHWAPTWELKARLVTALITASLQLPSDTCAGQGAPLLGTAVSRPLRALSAACGLHRHPIRVHKRNATASSLGRRPRHRAPSLTRLSAALCCRMAVSLHAPGRCIVSARAGARHARIPCRSLVVAAAGADFSPEQQAASLQHQLRKSQQAAAEAAASKATAGMAETHSRIPTKKAPRREARAAAAAAAVRWRGCYARRFCSRSEHVCPADPVLRRCCLLC